MQKAKLTLFISLRLQPRKRMKLSTGYFYANRHLLTQIHYIFRRN